METFTLITAVCFALLTAEVLYFVVSLCARKRAERINFLRGFKKAKCALIYFIAIPLFCIGHIYAGQDFFNAFFAAINQTVTLVVLKYSTSTITALMSANVFYRITIFYCFTLVAINALMFTVSLLGQRLWEWWRSFVFFRLTHKDKLYIFGSCDNNLDIYRSDRVHAKILVDKLDQEKRNRMYLDKISYVCDDPKRLVEGIFDCLKKRKNGISVVINTGSDEKNISFCRLFIAKLDSVKDKIDYFERLKVYVFGDPKHETAYSDIMAASYGCISYKDRHLMVAMNFVKKYPMAYFLGENIIADTSLINDEVKLNVCMIGFGKTNRQIFLTSVANNQFLTKRDGKIALKQVNYHIFDKEPAENNKNLNHTYYRFRNEVGDSNDYLPLPDAPAVEKYYHLDVNSQAFYSDIRSVVSSVRSLNFIVIAFGSDLENVDMAHKLADKRDEWGVENVYIFVKIRGDLSFCRKDCFVIGNEKDEVYNIDAITDDDILRMAKLRYQVYDLEYKIAHDKECVVDDNFVERCKKQSDYNWYVKKHRWERESDVYCCLAIRSKLNLMGLDCVKGDGGMDESEYFSVYAKDDMPTFMDGVLNKKVVRYDIDFKPSLRTTLAIQEHYRWNSFMISKGMIPSTKQCILGEQVWKDGKTEFTNGKNYALRRHGNITTYDGLVQFRKLVSTRDNTSERTADVMKYDYQLLDDAYWLLHECGYMIIRK